MNEILENTQELNLEEIKQSESPQKKQKNNIFGTIFTIILVLICAGCTYYLASDSIFGPFIRAGKDSYDQAKNTKYEEVYAASKEEAYEKAEKAYHLSTKVDVFIKAAVKESKLVPLYLEDTKFITINSSEILLLSNEILLHIPVKAKMVIDLKQAEFITDDYYNQILIRLPKPALEDVVANPGDVKTTTIKTNAIEFLQEKINDVLPGNKSIDEYLDESCKQAQEEAYVTFASNEEYIDQAEKNAENILKSLIGSLFDGDENPPTVTIEFF